MATTILKTLSLIPSPNKLNTSHRRRPLICLSSFNHKHTNSNSQIKLFNNNNNTQRRPFWVLNKFAPFNIFVAAAAAVEGEAQTQTEAEVEAEVEVEAETEIQESSDSEASVAEDDVPIEDSEDSESADAVEESVSAILASLQSYKEALLSNDESKIAEVEAFLLAIEEEKESLASKVATLSEELSPVKDRVIRISADFDNFRKRTERERLSLVTNVQGEVVEKLLPVLDNFERAKTQIKVEAEGEEKINNSYQNISKQFFEILESLGVVPVETVGSPFDPLVHEAIMREDSAEFEEGVVLQEFRKGFKLGDRLLRPSMVKVSSGPGPVKPKEDAVIEVEAVEAEVDSETSDESKTEGASAK